MRMRCFMVFVVIGLGTFGSGTAQGQQASPEGRKVVRRVMPTYPEIAKRMGLTGTVKVVAIVAPDGSVKNVEPVGGGPVLIQASKDAILKWKFSAAPAESREEVVLHFDPQQ